MHTDAFIQGFLHAKQFAKLVWLVHGRGCEGVGGSGKGKLFGLIGRL